MATSQEQSGLDSPQPTYTISLSRGMAISCVAWLPGDRIVTDSYDDTLRIRNLTDGIQEGASMIHDHELHSIVATKDGRIISCCLDDEHLTVWNVDTQKLVERTRSNRVRGDPRLILLSQNEEVLASWHSSGFAIWEMEGTMRLRNHFRHHHQPTVIAACLSPNGSRIAVYAAWRFSVLDTESGEYIFDVDRHHSAPISWSLDGCRLFCGDGRSEIHCFNSETGESVGEPWTGHTDEVTSMSLSPDGKWLASGSSDRTVRFWNAETGKPEGQSLLHEKPVGKIAFSHSGEFLMSTMYPNSSTIFIWRVPWWHDRNQNTPNALLDMSAVVPPDASGPSNIPDLGFLDVSPPRRPLPPQTHSRGNPSNGPPRIQDSVRSWQWWKRIPRLVFLRSHSVYTGPVPPRIYVASWENVDNSQRSQSLSSSEENSEGSSDTPSAGLEPEVGELEIGCCGFLPRRQPRATAAQGRRDARGARPSRSDRPPTSNDTGSPIPSSTHPATQDILELSAIVRSADAR